jgi:hypothetical protein
MKKKRPYLLLELVIAFFLLSICALPLVRNPLRLLSQQFKELERAELARRASVDFAEIRGMLNNKEDGISWDALDKPVPKKNKKVPHDKQDEVMIQLAKPRKFLKKIHWGTVKEKDAKNGKKVRLINIRISYEPLDSKGEEIDFDWRVVVTRPLPTSTNSATEGKS